MEIIHSTVKATIIDLVRAGQKVEDVILLFHWTEAFLATFGVHTTVEFVTKALDGIFEKHSAGLTTHAKKYVNFADDSPWSMGAMVGSVEGIAGAKVISFSPDNGASGLPVSHADGFLADKETGVRKMTLECIGASNLRTGWFALAFFNLVFQTETEVEVLIIGAGPVAVACIQMLNYGAADKIRRIKVMSKSGTSNFKMVERLQPEIKIPLEATNDRSDIRLAKYLITATNAGQPVVEEHEIGNNAAVLSQGIDDLPPAYLERVIRGGQKLGDDLHAMQERNVDSLAIYYSSRGQKLTVEGKKDGAANIGDVFNDRALLGTLSACDIAFFPVGLMAYDIAVNNAVREALIRAILNAV